ncbi:MAG TPA: cytosine permease [Candidatus Dormibacteraeota bacterium]
MATVEQVDVHVPIREGEYGEKVAAIEPGGVEYIPLAERHGRPLDLFWTWMSPNLEFATVYVGVLGIAVFGGSFLSVTLGIIVGTAIGSLTHGILSSWGPRFGVPQMVQSRAGFGFWGNILPAGLNALTANVGWFIVNSVSGAFALSALTNGALPFVVTFTIIVLAQVLVAFFGHNLVHVFERYAFVPLVIIFGLATIFTFTHVQGVGFNAKAPLAFGGDFGAFMLTAGTALGYAVGWNPYASDYTRYQRPDTNRTMVGFWAGFGVFLSCVVLELMGAALATAAGTKWGPNDIPTAQMVNTMPSVIYYATLIAIALGAVAANVINIYSGSMSVLTLGINIPSHIRRAIVAVAAGVLGLVIGFAAQANVGPGSKYEGFLLVITYWIGAWLGVVLTDYWMRRGAFGDEAIFYERSYANWAGPIAMFVGGAIAIWLFADQSVYVGYVAFHYPQIGDMTFVVGFILTAVIYYVLRMSVFKPVARESSSTTV